MRRAGLAREGPCFGRLRQLVFRRRIIGWSAAVVGRGSPLSSALAVVIFEICFYSKSVFGQ